MGVEATAQGAMAILVVACHIILTVCGQAVVVVLQHMVEPIMVMAIGQSLIIMGIVAGIATGLLLMDMVVVGLLGVAVVVAGDDEVVISVVYRCVCARRMLWLNFIILCLPM